MELTPQETSVLSFIASADNVPKSQLDRLMTQLSDEAKEIASAILEIKRHRLGRLAALSVDAQESAKALLGQS